MNHFVALISFCANLIAIGDLFYKISSGAHYNFFTYLFWIFIVIGLQAFFVWLLEIKNMDESSYISVLYGLLIPVTLSVGYFGFYKISGNVNIDFWDSLWEALKLLIIFAVIEGIFLFWTNLCELSFHREKEYLAFAFGIPSLLITSLGIERYIISGIELDRFFVGYLLLVLSAPVLAAATKDFK